MQKLVADLITALAKQVLVITCFVDADGERHGVTDKDQAALEIYEAAAALTGFDDEKGPLIIILPEAIKDV